MVARFMLKTSNAVNDVIRRLDEEAFRNALPDDGREHVVRCVQELRTLAGDPSVAAAELATLQASLEPVLTVCRDFLACADTHGVPSEEMNDATPILTSGFSPELEAALKALPNQFLAFTAAVAIAQGSTADLPRATPSVITAADQTAEIVYDPSKHATVAQVFTAKVCCTRCQKKEKVCIWNPPGVRCGACNTARAQCTFKPDGIETPVAEWVEQIRKKVPGFTPKQLRAEKRTTKSSLDQAGDQFTNYTIETLRERIAEATQKTEAYIGAAHKAVLEVSRTHAELTGMLHNSTKSMTALLAATGSAGPTPQHMATFFNERGFYKLP